MTTLEIQTLTAGYSKSNPVFRNLNLVIPQHKATAVWGRNGCGKSTLVGVLASLIPVVEGRVFFEHHLFEGKHLKKIAFVFDRPVFPSLLFPNQIITFFMDLYPKKVARTEVLKLMDVCGLKNIKKCFFQLSTGMKRRLAILVALLKDPALLIIDESFASLDPEHKVKLTQHLRSKMDKKEMTLLFTAHSQDECVSLADEIKPFCSLGEMQHADSSSLVP